ncbi:hypothetical protein QTH90_20875 [Variovorax sp. J2P1-59]|uniref:hypothetical protein n=1 Tax=Variovorax flavidus TaxID=3053501 RepID=UPI002578DE51|nr:hypothetical protein [Variovorax sp. J2P1-59]MDM0076875.1 hypothetical protein [Variovorax sp. J2P1-59]
MTLSKRFDCRARQVATPISLERLCFGVQALLLLSKLVEESIASFPARLGAEGLDLQQKFLCFCVNRG